MLCLLSYWHL